ncbi:MAG: hypothetical protein AB7S26_30765 [Sandaracinaceae bacterium]
MGTKLRGLVMMMVVAACASACTRSVCDFDNGGLEPNLTGRWASSRELIPPSATVCGHFNGMGTPNESSITFDFEDDDNPFVTITRHLESQGWGRSEQNIDNPDRMTATFMKDGEALLLTTTREDGRTWAELSFP